MISFLVGAYIGGAIVEGTISLSVGENKIEAATAAALWPYAVSRVIFKFFTS